MARPFLYPDTALPYAAVRAFISQRHSAGKRGIAWELSLDDWWRIWQDSGMWEERGPTRSGYCMARHGDVGPYSASNVYITTMRENTKDYYRVHRAAHSAQTRKLNLERSLRTARGWTYLNGKAKPYQVMLSSKRIGCFATQAEAEAAHRHAVMEALAHAG
jgi:hypothetical protein